jgi:hypothetical protein
MSRIRKPRTEPDASPPEKKAPRLATEARINRLVIDSCARFYHKRTETPSGRRSLLSPLLTKAWSRLQSLGSRKEVGA